MGDDSGHKAAAAVLLRKAWGPEAGNDSGRLEGRDGGEG